MFKPLTLPSDSAKLVSSLGSMCENPTVGTQRAADTKKIRGARASSVLPLYYSNTD